MMKIYLSQQRNWEKCIHELVQYHINRYRVAITGDVSYSQIIVDKQKLAHAIGNVVRNTIQYYQS